MHMSHCVTTGVIKLPILVGYLKKLIIFEPFFLIVSCIKFGYTFSYFTTPILLSKIQTIRRCQRKIFSHNKMPPPALDVLMTVKPSSNVLNRCCGVAVAGTRETCGCASRVRWMAMATKLGSLDGRPKLERTNVALRKPGFFLGDDGIFFIYL